MTLKIEVLGAECNKCNKLFSRLKKIVAAYLLDAEVTKSTNPNEIMSFGINYLPALFINGTLISQGVVLSNREIMLHLNKYLEDDKKMILPEKKKISLSILLIFSSLIGIVFMVLISQNVKSKHTNQKDSAKFVSPLSTEEKLMQQFVYVQKSTSFKMTFLEFGSVNCSECKKMEKVMENVKTNFPDEVKVIFFDVRKKENKPMMELFKIDFIPAQILLDSSGVECFRHVGYIDYEELIKKFHL